MEENSIELIEEKGLTSLKVNGQKISRLCSYNVSKKELNQLEVTITFMANSKKSSVGI